MSLKYWKPFFWDAVQHFLHPTNAILHHHIRERRVKGIGYRADSLERHGENLQQRGWKTRRKDIFSVSLHCRERQPTGSRSCVGVSLAAVFPCEHKEIAWSSTEKRFTVNIKRSWLTAQVRLGLMGRALRPIQTSKDLRRNNYANAYYRLFYCCAKRISVQGRHTEQHLI